MQTRVAWQRTASTRMPWEAETEASGHATAVMTAVVAAALKSMLEHWHSECCFRQRRGSCHCLVPVRPSPPHSLALAAAVALVAEAEVERPRLTLPRPNRRRPQRAQRARPPSTAGRQCCHYSKEMVLTMRMWTRSTHEHSPSRLRRVLRMQPTMRAKAPPKDARRNPNAAHRRHIQASGDRAKSDERTRCEARNMIAPEVIPCHGGDQNYIWHAQIPAITHICEYPPFHSFPSHENTQRTDPRGTARCRPFAARATTPDTRRAPTRTERRRPPRSRGDCAICRECAARAGRELAARDASWAMEREDGICQQKTSSVSPCSTLAEAAAPQ